MSQFIGVACIPRKNTGKLTCFKRPLQDAPDGFEFWLKMYYLRTSGEITLVDGYDSEAAPMLA
jgi:hypothetical protein